MFSALIFSGRLELWHVFAFAVVAGGVTAFEFPAAQGLAPELVDHERIPQAVAMMQSIFHGARLVGPALAGVLIRRFGEASAFLANGLSFLAVIASLLLIAPKHDEAAARPAHKGDFLDGIRYARRDPATRLLLTMMTLTMALVFPFLIVLMVYYVRYVIAAGAEGMGSMMSASGFGALCGALWLLAGEPAKWPRRLLIGVSGITACLVGLALNHRLDVAVVLSGFLSLSTSQVVGTASQVVQWRVPPEIRGRVMALFGMSFTSVLPVSAVLSSYLADLAGLSRLMLIYAAVYFLISARLLWRVHAVAAESLTTPTSAR
jgi:MFS family permease